MVRAQQYRMFWRELGIMLEVGIEFKTALLKIQKTYERTGDNFYSLLVEMIKNYLSNIDLSRVENGESLFVSAMRQSNLFSELEIQIFRSGELSGMLPVYCAKLADKATPLTRANQYSLFYSTLALELSSGLPILTALKIGSAGLDESLKTAVDVIIESVKEGEKIAVGMIRSGEFSFEEIQLVQDNADSLDFALSKLSNMSGSSAV